MADLRTDFVDDVLDTTQNLSRVYNIKNRDGSIVQADVMIEDTSVYTQTGSTFGATQMNETNEAVNELNENLTKFLKVDKVSFSGSQITANTPFFITKDVPSIEGYKPLGVCGFNLTRGNINYTVMDLANNQLTLGGIGSVTSFTGYVWILYMKI